MNGDEGFVRFEDAIEASRRWTERPFTYEADAEYRVAAGIEKVRILT
jgi:hypothetical protein